MRLELHPLAHSDISRIVDHYKRAGGTDLADDFYSELRSFFD
jgi:plasmid stabilization system protein ParE